MPLEFQQIESDVYQNVAPISTAHFVLIAEGIDVGMVNQFWLVKNGLATEQDLKTGGFFGPEGAMINTPHYQILVQSDRLQITLGPEAINDAGPHLSGLLHAFFGALPQIKPVALGINFDSFFQPANRDFASWCREGFCAPVARSIKETQSNDARFGCYASFDAKPYRVRIDLKPSRISNRQQDGNRAFGPGFTQEVIEVMHASINFHQDSVDQDSAIRSIEDWQQTVGRVQGIMRSLLP